MNRTPTKQVSRYHPLLVTLHWLLAVMIVAALIVGFFWLAATPNANPQKIVALRWHMAGGMLMLALMVIRFIVRLSTWRPSDATTGYSLLDRLALIAHYGFYGRALPSRRDEGRIAAADALRATCAKSRGAGGIGARSRHAAIVWAA